MRGKVAASSLAAVVLVVGSLLLAGCGESEADPPLGGASRTPATVPDAAPEDFVGHWRSDWGDLYLRAGPDGTVRGVYAYNTGTMSGRVLDGAFSGWWCQLPTRDLPSNAGEVRFRLAQQTEPGEPPKLIGQWRYGTNGNFNESWDAVQVSEAPGDGTVVDQRFAAESTFCRHPAP